MPVLAYLLAIVIWTTTPLAIKLSNDSVTPILSISLRMILAIILGLAILLIMRRFSVFDRRNLKIYSAGALGIFPNMVLIYYAAQFISSGLLAVLMGFSPFITGVLAHYLLGDEFFIRRKLIAQMIALSGLFFVYQGQMSIDAQGGVGVLLMLCSAFLFALSTVLVKLCSKSVSVAPLDQTVGAMMLSLPGLALSWLFLDGQMDITLSATSLWSIIYLAVIGSLVGFVLYFYVLNRLSAGLVSLTLLITPVFALILGRVLADEVVSLPIVLGSALILSGLFLYENIFTMLYSATKSLSK